MAMECYNDADYEGYVNYTKMKYDDTKNDEDLKEYEKALKIRALSDEIQDIIKLEGKSVYKILNINDNATQEEIKRKFRVLATKYHPSKANVKGAKDAMRIIQKAYFEINTEEKKKSYDNSKNIPSFLNKDLGDVFSRFNVSSNLVNGVSYGPYGFSFSTTLGNQIPPFVFGNSFYPNEIYANLYRNSTYRRRAPRSSGRNNFIRYLTIFLFILLIILS